LGDSALKSVTMGETLARILGNKPAFPPLPTPWSAQAVDYVDVGARGGPTSSWLKLTNRIEYICFEPDPAEAGSLRRFFESRQEFKGLVMARALGAHEGLVSLNLTRFPPASSIFQPNHNLLRDFEIHPFLEVDRVVEVPVATLDAQLHTISKSCDFLKIDVQGYELEVLKGAENALKNSRGCELEVSFIEIYRDQPLFAEIDFFMRARGFFLADLERVWWHYADVPDYAKLRGSLAYGNALYLRKDIAEPSDRQQLLVNTIICIATGLNELAFQCAAHGRRRGLISNIEEQAFQKWMMTACCHTTFWNKARGVVSRLPGHQTLSRWLGLLSRSLQGPSPIGADSNSWLRRNSW